MADSATGLRGWLQRRFVRLRGQAFAHLLLVGVVAALVVVATGLAAFYVVEGRDVAQRRDVTRDYYADQLVRLESAWRISADQVLGRIEFSRLLESGGPATTAKLSAFLNAQWAFLDFPTMLVLGPGGDVRYRYGPIAHAIKPADIAGTSWFVVPSHEEIYRIFQLPIWLGPDGQGSLLLLRPINGEVLRQLLVPDVHLEIYVRPARDWCARTRS